MFNLAFRDMLPQWLIDELDQLVSGIKAFLLEPTGEHNDDGTHGDVNADSLTTTGSVQAAGGENIFGEFKLESGASSNGENLHFAYAETTNWVISRRSASGILSGQSLKVFDYAKESANPVFELGFYTTGDYYVFIPRNAGGKALVLGYKDGTSADRIKYLAVQDGVYELGRSAANGYWTAVTHAGGNYTANGAMTWTVESGDQTTSAYTFTAGKTMVFSVYVVTSTIGGTLNNELRVAIPGGFTVARTMAVGCLVEDNGVTSAGFARVEAGVTLVKISKADGSNFAGGTNNCGVRFTIEFETQ